MAVRPLGQALLLVALALLPAVLPARPAHAAPTPQVDDSVVVQITSPTRGQQAQGLVEIRGYAADTRSTSGSGLNESDIQIWLNGKERVDYTDEAKEFTPEGFFALQVHSGKSCKVRWRNIRIKEL